MSEQVLPLPLSGGEIIKSVLHHVEQMLRKDCYLNDVAAYETVQGTVSVRLAMKDCGRDAVVDAVIPVQSGPVVAEGDEDVYLNEADRTLMAAPPNQVRQETDQPLPVLVEDSTGRREVKRIQYAKPKGAGRTIGRHVRAAMAAAEAPVRVPAAAMVAEPEVMDDADYGDDAGSAGDAGEVL